MNIQKHRLLNTEDKQVVARGEAVGSMGEVGDGDKEGPNPSYKMNESRR